MKINNIHQGKIKGLSDSSDVQQDEKASRRKKSMTGKRSASEVSRLSQLVSKARVAAERISDIRPEKMAEVRQKLTDGFYNSEEVRNQLVIKLAEKLRVIMGR